MDDSGAQLRRYVQILRRRWVLIALLVTVTAGSAFLVSLRTRKVYRAATQLQVQPVGSGGSSSSDLLNLFANPTLVLTTDVKLIQSDAVLGPAAKALGLASSTPLRDAVSVQLVPNTMILEIDASQGVPSLARDWANEVADSFITFQRSRAIEQVVVSSADITRRIVDLQAQIAASRPSPASGTVVASLSTQVGALESQLQSLPGATALSTGGGSVIVPASTPTFPISPRTRQNIVLGGLLGLLVAVGLVLLMESLDDRLRGTEEVEERAGAPTLGSVPFARELSGTSAPASIVHQPSSVVAEAYRTLRTNLGFLSVERPLRTILVTSSVKGEGKSTTAANLAAAFALSGVKTILISADLRRPSAHKFFGLPNSLGVVDALRPGVSLESLLQRNCLPDFRLLAAGRIPPNPAEILSSSRFGEVLATLSEASDLVIIDSSPLLGVADASALASRVDGVLLVVNPREVDRRTFALATDQLRKAGGRTLGTVMNAVGPGQGYPYDYGRYYSEDGATGGRRGRRQRKAEEDRAGRDAALLSRA